ncbi:MAG: hypothetical protein P8171_21305 [Candidatus Thiodiazotropha sp.]
MFTTISSTTKSDATPINSHLSLIPLVMLLLLGFALTSQAQSAPVCGPDVKEEVASLLANMADLPDSERLALEDELYNQFSYCAQDTADVPKAQAVATNSFYIAAAECGAKISNLGSLYYEQMSCCGYDPQRRQFACPVTIKQVFGFGAAPLMGSREYVLHCVANNSGVFVPVGSDSVHLANAMWGNGPTWQFAVIANANKNLNTIYPMNGQTRRARSILSWGLQPTSCNYRPIWGNALNYSIRLDQ